MITKRNQAHEASGDVATASHGSLQRRPTGGSRSGPKNRSRRIFLKNRFITFCAMTALALLTSNFWGHQKLASEATDHLVDPSGSFPIHRINRSTHITKDPVSRSSLGRQPTNDACEGFQGVYHIEKGDIGGAAGTIFFQFVIGQIIWAEQNNFKPWVHLNNISYVIYDPIVHGRGPGVSFQMMDGLKISSVQRQNGHWRDSYPGEPTNFQDLVPKEFNFDGSGVWEDYFEPVSDFEPGDTSCNNKPLVTMDLYQVTPGVHGFAPWAPRCWRYQYLPDYVTKPHVPLQEWLEPQRHLAHDVLVKYIRFSPHIREKAYRVNPDCSIENACLAIHIRQSDKAAGRRQIQTEEFLPFVEAFLKSGGRWIYLATDSGKVMEHVKTEWPPYVRDKVRSLGDNVVRSDDHHAVFDIASHHLTNTEILIEILALAQCQFMVHGLSAVTETSIWINVDLHYTSVNLEDPDHLNSIEFGYLVRKVLDGGNASEIIREQRPADWWKADFKSSAIASGEACNDIDAILHIGHVGEETGAGTAFFTSVLNQLYYAERYNLKPWIHLGNESAYIYDEGIHGNSDGVTLTGMIHDMEPTPEINERNASFFYPGAPKRVSLLSKALHYPNDGIWTHYFEQVSDFVPGDKSCTGKSIISLSSQMVNPGLYSWCPWAIRAWRNDDVPDDLWKPDDMPLKTWVEPMRRKANQLVEKFLKFHPHLLNRAQEVNPVNATSPPCMAIHLRNSDKGKNLYRSKFPVNKFRDYINAFMRAGGSNIYVATDSHKVLEFIEGHFPEQIWRAIRTQGPYVVRSTSKWPIHSLEKHHRTNSEVLVDILAMAKCQLLLHGHSTVSEAAIYLNLDLHNQSVNWEDPNRMSAENFGALSRKVLETTNSKPVDIRPDDSVVQDPSVNVTVLKGSEERRCRRNAIVYLAQKRHSTYDRDSYGILLESLDLLYKNYLSLENHQDNADLIIFHTADFDSTDLDIFEEKYGAEFRNVVQLINLEGTKYWKRPSWHQNDNPLEWYAYPLFSEGYRRMMHWFAIDIWQFFGDHAIETGCNYEYVMRFDEDSFLHSPVHYDIFEFMKSNEYNYGFRLCAYEMQVTQRIWKLWQKSKGSPAPIRDIELEMCGIYNNFFVAKVSFFKSRLVQKFLRFVDRQGLIYRRRLGDLMIHSMAVYAFSPVEQIHRFLDFTYEHATVDKKSGCVMWGGIQAGYDDSHSDSTIDHYIQEKVTSKGCQANLTLMGTQNLSPTYAHLPARLNGKVALKTAMAGKVELPGRGNLSG